MSYLGTWQIDDVLTFPANTHAPDTGAATDADSAPSYRVYEDETATPILTGSMALLDGANTAGFYSEQITLSAANGFEVGKCYTIYVSATVGGVTGTMAHTFQVEAGLASAAALATVDGNVDAIKVVTDALTAAAAAKLALSGAAIVSGAAATGTLSTTQMTTDLTEATDDHYRRRVVIWTSGALAGQGSVITDYDGTSKMLTFLEVTEAPADGDDFVIL